MLLGVLDVCRVERHRRTRAGGHPAHPGHSLVGARGLLAILVLLIHVWTEQRQATNFRRPRRTTQPRSPSAVLLRQPPHRYRLATPRARCSPTTQQSDTAVSPITVCVAQPSRGPPAKGPYSGRFTIGQSRSGRGLTTLPMRPKTDVPSDEDERPPWRSLPCPSPDPLS